MLGRGKGPDNGQGREQGGDQLGTGTREDRRQRLGRPMSSLGSQLCRAAFLGALLLLLRVKGVKTQRGSPGLDERSQKEKTPSTGRGRRRRTPGDRDQASVEPDHWSGRRGS